jgi:hypothetical protein
LESSKLTAGKLHDAPVGDELCTAYSDLTVMADCSGIKDHIHLLHFYLWQSGHHIRTYPRLTIWFIIYLSVDSIFESLWFLSGFPWPRVSANKKEPEPKVPIYWLNWSHHFERFSVGTITWLTVTEYLCCKLWRICSICRKHFPVHSWFIIGSVSREIRWVPLEGE